MKCSIGYFHHSLSSSDDILLFCTAAEYNRLEMAELLLRELGLDVDGAEPESGATALHTAAGCGHIEMVQWLLRIGKAKVDAQNA